VRNIRLGVVGLGRGQGLGAIAMDHPRVELVALCDRNIAFHLRPGEFVEKIRSRGAKVEATYDDFDKFLEHEMDAVIVATPPAFHAPQSTAALRRGLHVLSEIPAAMSLAEAKALVAAARESTPVYMCGENCCWCGFVDAWKKWVDEGTLGKPFYLEGQYVHDLAIYIDPDRIKTTYPEDSQEATSGATWRTSFEPIRYCTHETGPLLEITGDRIAKIMAVSTGSNVRSEIGTLDMQVALGRTAGGAVVKLIAAFSVAREPAFHYYSLYASKGHAELKTGGNTKLFLKDVPGLANSMDVPVATGPSRPPPKWARHAESHGGADGAMLAAFLDAVLAGSPSPIDVYRGLDYSLPGILAAESARTGEKWLDVPDPRTW